MKTKESINIPSIGIHRAGPVVNGIQRCSRCGNVLEILMEPADDTLPYGPAYPEGALVERGKGWQATKLTGEPTCCRKSL
jgi:hypothetical protein